MTHLGVRSARRAAYGQPHRQRRRRVAQATMLCHNRCARWGSRRTTEFSCLLQFSQV